MPIQIFQDAGVARLEVTGHLSLGDAQEVRIAETELGLSADLGGVQAPVTPEVAQQLLAAGARDSRTNTG
jgi:hypothetical protein